jgi:hypothetical protein
LRGSGIHSWSKQVLSWNVIRSKFLLKPFYLRYFLLNSRDSSSSGLLNYPPEAAESIKIIVTSHP